MLGEAFLTEFLYKEPKNAKCCKPIRYKKKASNDENETWKNKFLNIGNISLCPLKKKNQENIIKGSSAEPNNDTDHIKSVDELPVAKCKSTPLLGNISIALAIPKREHDERQLDLYRSWSCTSICQNYPDLQIGGDHVGNMYGSDCFVEHCQDGIFNGPLLLSVDVPFSHSPKNESSEKIPTSKFLNGDEIREKSVLLYKQPLSNSMLNSYMEKKVDELYKQFLEENLTRCLSITNLMASNLLMNNVNQISFQISQEQNIEVAKAREALLHSLALCNLRNASHRNSTEISTPNLQISNQRSRESAAHP